MPAKGKAARAPKVGSALAEMALKGAPTPQVRRIANADVELVLPRSWAERHDVAAAGADNVQRACACALGLCWPRLRRRLPVYKGEPLVFGGAVIDFLRNEGATLDQILSAGIDALKLCADGLFDGKEVNARLDFSEAPGGGST